MKEQLREFFDMHVLQNNPHIAIAFIFSIIRTMYSKHKSNIIRYFMSSFVAVPVAWIVGEIAMPYFIDENHGVLFAVVAVAALLSENIVAGIISSGGSLQDAVKKYMEKSYKKIGAEKNERD